MVELSIITVNYNGLKDTQEMIESILNLDLSFLYELIIVDNGSKNDEASILHQEYPSIITIRSNDNLGFAGGNNLGIERSSGEILYFLNNDILLTKNTANEIKQMLLFLRNNPMVGGISPKIKYVQPSNLIQFAGSTPLSRITLRNSQIGYREEDKGQYNDLRQTPFLHGAAMMIPRKIVNEMGKMPECYFLYYEEIDWSTIIRQKYELYYFPQATVYHKESATTGIESSFKTYFLTRNRLIYTYRHRKGLIKPLSVLYQLFVSAPLHIGAYIKSGKFDQANAIIRGIDGFIQFLIQKQ